MKGLLFTHYNITLARRTVLLTFNEKFNIGISERLHVDVLFVLDL